MLKKLYFAFIILALCPQLLSGSAPSYDSEEILTEADLEKLMASGKGPTLYLEGLITEDDDEEEEEHMGAKDFQANPLTEAPAKKQAQDTAAYQLPLYVEGPVYENGYMGAVGFQVNPLTERLPKGPMS